MKKNFPNIRLRRLRNNSPIRNLIRENILSPHDLIQPIFIIEGNNKTEKIKSMPDIYRMSIDIAIKEIKILKKLGIQGVALFPCIEKKHKDIKGTESFNQDGLMQRAIRSIKKSVKDMINDKGLEQISDTTEIEKFIDQVLIDNPDNVQKYKDGKTKLLGFFIGEVMKVTKGKANPGLLNQLVKKKLDN